MQLLGMVKKRGSVAAMQQIWTEPQEEQQPLQQKGDMRDDGSGTIANAFDLENGISEAPSFSTVDEIDMEDQNDMSSETSSLLLPLQRRNITLNSNTSLAAIADKTIMSSTVLDSNHHNNNKYVQNHHKANTTITTATGNNNNGGSTKHPSPPSSSITKGLSTSLSSNILPLFRNPSPQPIKDVQPTIRPPATTLSTISTAQTKAVQLLVGAAGIYAAYLYYGVVQEDLFRYRSSNNAGFTFVWALQVLESAVTMVIGYIGRKLCGGRKNLPLLPFFHSGISQLAAKALMSLSLAAGLSFPVVVLAKSAKIVPVMIGQLLLGGSKYSFHDYLFAVMIVAGTSLLSAGNTSEHVASGSDTLSGLVLITLSLTADGFTGGLQKKLKRVTASMAPTTYDFLFYSHVAQFCAAIVVCFITGEMYTAPLYLINNPTIWWWIGASCVCSAVGQCFIFYVISCFDPVVCTTITTTRKMLTVMFSIGFKGHHLSSWGYAGLGLAVSALLIEVETKYAQYQLRQTGTVEAKQSPAATSNSSIIASPSSAVLSTSGNLSA